MLNCKVAYISDQQFPVRNATTEQVINTVSALSAEGLDIELIIPGTWRNLGSQKKELDKKLSKFYHIQNECNISRLLHLPFSPSKLDKLSHGLIAPIYASICQHDVVYTRNSLAAAVALALRKKVVLEVYRIYDQSTADGAKYLARRTAASNSLCVITHSIPSKASLIQAGAVEEKVKVIHNGFNPAPFAPAQTKTEARNRLGWRERDKIACFAGRIDIIKGATTILDLAERTPEIKYVLIGYSQNDKDDWILKAAEQKGLKNILKLPWVTSGELPQYLFASDVLLVPPTASPMAKYGRTVLPIKTFMYMGAGRCILAPALPDTAGVLNDQNAALVAPDNIDLAVKAIRKIFEDKAWARSIAKQAQLDSEKYTWERRAKKIIEFLNERLLAN
ncbi:MAG: glycosyltransferase [Bacteroidetes bacterium]|nr:glycosyltransferase [Bacteroidota bacterium]